MALLAGLQARYGGPEPADEEPTQTKARVARALVHYRLSQSDGIPAALPPPHERVLIGSAGCAYNKEGLTKAGVTHIVCLCSSVRHCFPSEFIYLTPQVEVNDDGTVAAAEQFKASMGSILRFISTALAESLQHKVLIHCMQGDYLTMMPELPSSALDHQHVQIQSSVRSSALSRGVVIDHNSLERCTPFVNAVRYAAAPSSTNLLL